MKEKEGWHEVVLRNYCHIGKACQPNHDNNFWGVIMGEAKKEFSLFSPASNGSLVSWYAVFRYLGNNQPRKRCKCR